MGPIRVDTMVISAGSFRYHLTSVDAPLVNGGDLSAIDLAALRLRVGPDGGASVPAAALPWFTTLFGRDGILANHQALSFAPGLAVARS